MDRKEQLKQYHEKWAEAEKEIKAGKVICLSALICNAERIYIDNLDKKTTGRAEMKSAIIDQNTVK